MKRRIRDLEERNENDSQLLDLLRIRKYGMVMIGTVRNDII